jgi:hypothetical protein
VGRICLPIPLPSGVCSGRLAAVVQAGRGATSELDSAADADGGSICIVDGLDRHLASCIEHGPVPSFSSVPPSILWIPSLCPYSLSLLFCSSLNTSLPSVRFCVRIAGNGKVSGSISNVKPSRALLRAFATKGFAMLLRPGRTNSLPPASRFSSWNISITCVAM